MGEVNGKVVIVVLPFWQISVDFWVFYLISTHYRTVNNAFIGTIVNGVFEVLLDVVFPKLALKVKLKNIGIDAVVYHNHIIIRAELINRIGNNHVVIVVPQHAFSHRFKC